MASPNSVDAPFLTQLKIDDEDYDKYIQNIVRPDRKKELKATKRKKKPSQKKSRNKEIIEPDKPVEEEDLKDWLKLGLPMSICSCLYESGFPKPTPVQESCIPSLIKLKNDAIVAAETGSGKTLIYILPILNRLLFMASTEDSKKDWSCKLRALVITPTRELAIQVTDHARLLLSKFNFYATTIIGGLSSIKQERLLDKKPQVVIGTPGRIWSYMDETPHPHLTDLSGLRLLVIDEVDRMTEQGHFFQLKKILGYIQKSESNSYSTYVFSASLNVKKTQLKYKSKSQDVCQKIKKFLDMKSGTTIFNLCGSKITPSSLSEYKIFCLASEKPLFLYRLLKMDFEKIIIFVNNITTGNWLRDFFKCLEIPVVILHSHMEQKSRLKVYDRFKEEKSSILIATDIAARGLDICDVGLVIHYDTPKNPDSYVHRSGRTARVSKIGSSILFVVPEELEAYRKILKSLSRKEDLADFKMNDEGRQYQTIVSLASSITDGMVKIHKLTHPDSWFKKYAEESDMVVDKDFCKTKKIDKNALKKLQQTLTNERKQLKSFLIK